MKKIIITLIFSLLFVGSVFAGWYTCTINSVGPGYSQIYIYLTDNASTPAFTNRVFKADAIMKKEILATALTAKINNKKVKAAVTDTSAYSTLKAIYIIDE